jgi:hypothetical protein
VIVNVTYSCNNHCTFCAVGTRTQVHGTLDATARAPRRSTARRASPCSTSTAASRRSTPSSSRWCSYARAHRLRAQSTSPPTGGSAPTRSTRARCSRSGLTTLLFSVHGPTRSSHAQTGGRRGGLRADRAGHPQLRRSTRRRASSSAGHEHHPHQEQSPRELEAVTQLAWDLGLRWLNIQFLTPFGRATKWIAPDTAEAAAHRHGRDRHAGAIA